MGDNRLCLLARPEPRTTCCKYLLTRLNLWPNAERQRQRRTQQMGQMAAKGRKFLLLMSKLSKTNLKLLPTLQYSIKTTLTQPQLNATLTEREGQRESCTWTWTCTRSGAAIGAADCALSGCLFLFVFMSYNLIEIALCCSDNARAPPLACEWGALLGRQSRSALFSYLPNARVKYDEALSSRTAATVERPGV